MISSKVGFVICIWLKANVRKVVFSLLISSNDRLRDTNGFDGDFIGLFISELCK